MSYTIYIYSKCSTCKEALRFLEKHQIKFIRKEITETPPSRAELELMLNFQDGNVRKLFNTSGILYRELELSKKLPELTKEQALDLLTTNGMLVKRPFLLGENIGLVGFREEQWPKA